jgi:hypothetical protein
MKFTILILFFFICLFSCNDTKTKNDKKKYVEFFKFFDPLAFRGLQSIDSTSKDYPFYKVHYDTLGNITRIDEYPLAYGDGHDFNSWLVTGKNNRILFDSTDGAFQDEVTITYRLFVDEKVITIYNFLYTNSNRAFTSFVNIYIPNKVLEYSFFGDGHINELDIDSTYLKKVILVTPKDILTKKDWLDTTHLESKSIRYLSNSQNEIVANTFYFDNDTSINQIFKYNNKKFDNFWVGKYNFYDSIGAKLYYSKYLKYK